MERLLPRRGQAWEAEEVIEQTTIDGRAATVSYMDRGFNLVPVADAELVKVMFDDGEMAFLVPGDVAKAASKTLYVKRQLLNSNQVREWAASQGIASALPADDMHVTIAFSKEPVDWSKFSPDPYFVSVVTGDRAVHQFPPRNTPNGALVLKFSSEPLTERWQYYRDGGASWDFPDYQPHVTITYSVPEADVAAIQPYTGPLNFGPEEWAEVDEGWAGEINEEPLVKG